MSFRGGLRGRGWGPNFDFEPRPKPKVLTTKVMNVKVWLYEIGGPRDRKSKGQKI
jgi:hypothetical protein